MAATPYRERVNALACWIMECKRAVFFGGAGVSTESGIPDFRSASGLYNKRADEAAFAGIPPETLLSRDFFFAHTDLFYDYYRAHICHPGAMPNAAHTALARLEAVGRLSCVITQNIDGLHQAAGSANVYELHGGIRSNACLSCGKSHALERVLEARGVPRCACGGLIKPDVVLYGEALPEGAVRAAVAAVRAADLLIVGGTSLAVYPAAGLIDYFRGARSALINRDETPRDGDMDIVFRENIAAVLGDTACEVERLMCG